MACVGLDARQRSMLLWWACARLQMRMRLACPSSSAGAPLLPGLYAELGKRSVNEVVWNVRATREGRAGMCACVLIRPGALAAVLGTLQNRKPGEGQGTRCCFLMPQLKTLCAWVQFQGLLHLCSASNVMAVAAKQQG